MLIPEHELLFATDGRDRMPRRLRRLRDALAWGACLGLTDQAGLTALHRAARHGAEPLVQALLAAGAQPRACGPLRQSPLHLAINASVPDETAEAIVCRLLAAGVAADVRDAQGVTSLQLAARWGALGTTRALLAAGMPANIADAVGLTPLHEAAHRGHRAVCAMLLEHGADATRENAFGVSAIEFSLDRRTRELLGAAAHAISHSRRIASRRSKP